MLQNDEIVLFCVLCLCLCLCLFWFVLFCFVLFCFVLFWFGLVWFGLVWFGFILDYDATNLSCFTILFITKSKCSYDITLLGNLSE